MEMKKTVSLSILFMRYLVVFCFVIIIEFGIVLLSFYYALQNGIIRPANYSEQVINNMESQLTGNETFDPSLIPFPCTYVLFDQDLHVQSSNMSSQQIGDITEVLSSGEGALSQNQYKYLERNQGCPLIIKYDIQAHFADSRLHKLFPKPEWGVLILLFTWMIITGILIAFQFSKKLKKELTPLAQATDEIKQKNLEFEIAHTHIREFHTILQSIDELKSALSSSLKEQWEMERHKNFQLSAIIHDVKTPLTIIKGNTELLLESNPSKEDEKLLRYIQTGSDKIENYMSLLMTTASQLEEQIIKKDTFSVSKFIMEIEKEGQALCKIKHLVLCVECIGVPETFYGDAELIGRAVLNILDNAAEYSPIGGNIDFKIVGRDHVLSFIIIDNGKGFTSYGLKNAAVEFYSEQTERSGKHYGLGLSIAKTVAELHDGQLKITNRKQNNGAVVLLQIGSK